MGFNMYSPARIIFGRGELKNLHTLDMPGKKALIVISDGKTAYVNGGLEQLKKELEILNIDYAIYDRVHQNPTDAMVDNGVDFARANDCDFVIALGGGSVMDVGKAISLMVPQQNRYWYYVDHIEDIKHEWLPVITIATDAGTGSDSDPYMCITNWEKHIKRGLPNTKIIGTFPIYAILDPELMATVPSDFTAYQGFDTLFHAIEGYICNKSNLMSDMYALTSIKTVAENLADAVRDGNNMYAREMMAFANHLSSIVMFVSYTCSEHSIEHGMGAYHLDLPHGAGILSFCKEYFKFFVEHHACDDRFISMARVMGKPDSNDPMDFVRLLEDLMQKCGVGEVKMSDFGISRDELPMFIDNSFETNGPGYLNDIVLLSRGDAIGILNRSYK